VAFKHRFDVHKGVTVALLTVLLYAHYGWWGVAISLGVQLIIVVLVGVRARFSD